MRKVVEPESIRGKFAGSEEEVLRHPAYAQVAIHHVSGHADLYGSDFTHQHYVTLTVKRSELHRSLARDWHFERDELIEIALSEAQYATMISAPNRTGVPCTLQRYNGEMIPGLPRRDSTNLHSDEFKEKLSKTVTALRQQRAEIETAVVGVSKKMREQLLGPINAAIREIESNIPFLVDSFSEHMETNIEKAKVEVNAYVTNTIHRAGLDALQGSTPMLTFEPKKD